MALLAVPARLPLAVGWPQPHAYALLMRLNLAVLFILFIHCLQCLALWQGVHFNPPPPAPGGSALKHRSCSTTRMH